MLRPKFNSRTFRVEIEKRINRINLAILQRLKIVGEEFINNARSKTKTGGGFGDLSGNLRSSIGYVILHNGKEVIGSEFESFKSGKEGSETGEKLIKKIASQYAEHSSFVLIVVAGMDYAAAVESKGYDVITGSSLIAESDLRKGLENIKKKV